MKKFLRRTALFLFMIYTLAANANAADLLIPGGQVIGLELQDNTVTVAAFDDSLGAAARDAGLKEGDRILRIDDTKIACAEDVRKALTHSDGHVDIAVLRSGKTKELSLSPALTKDGPRLGVYLKQGTTGIGTVTYYDPETEDFAALGHGVNSQNGSLVQMEKGTVYPAQVKAVKKGAVGAPGQLCGRLSGNTPAGTIDKNTVQGVFGNLDLDISGTPLPVGEAEDVHTGSATIRSTIEGNTLREYSVEILKIYPNHNGRNRNMLLKVTDPTLLETTGGIVQGMSGSPIIQDGKLIGAVTHVLVNDPTTGYGIFIENMLDAAA